MPGTESQLLQANFLPKNPGEGEASKQAVVHADKCWQRGHC